MQLSVFDHAIQLIRDSRHMIAVTGAGISVDSGIPAFRGDTGLWNTYDPSVYASIEGFRENPRRSWEFFLELYDQLIDARPNAAHTILAEWEQKGLLQGIITQNIDDLHQQAGSHHVIEVHGSLRNLICTTCGQIIHSRGMIFDSVDLPPMCRCGGILKPEAVLFGESIPSTWYFACLEAIRKADTILFIGTSGIVHPVNEFPEIALRHGCRLIEINPDATVLTRLYDMIHLQGFANDVLTRLAEAFNEQ
ncbi:NAD-dependent deacylase [bacterium]|nr:NAD-dependent deacylase [candidate division CSSED10-310 bacterium]